MTLTVTITDASGRSVPGLDKRAFTVHDDKSLQEISFFSDTDAPMSIGIVFDLSASMTGEKIRRAREALGHFMATSLVSDEYSVIVFNEQAQVLLERSRDSKAVLEKLSTANPHGALRCMTLAIWESRDLPGGPILSACCYSSVMVRTTTLATGWTTFDTHCESQMWCSIPSALLPRFNLAAKPERECGTGEKER